MTTTLKQLYLAHKGKVSDKWESYLTAYEEVLSPYRNNPIHLLEIGIQNGGSLEIWAKYFAHAKLFVGCDINEACRALVYEDPRIQVVIGDANCDVTEAEIRKHSEQFDFIVDDGSHFSGDIVESFCRYFPLLKEGGIFIAEDLHCSYWRGFEGGIYAPQSAMAFFRRLADVINFEHWGVAGRRADVLRGFSRWRGTILNELSLDELYSVEFRNSICCVRRRTAAEVALGRRVVVGESQQVSANELPLNGLFGHEIGIPHESGNPWSDLQSPPEVELPRLQTKLSEAQSEVDNLEARHAQELALIAELRSEVAGLEASHERELALIAELRSEVAGLEASHARELVRISENSAREAALHAHERQQSELTACMRQQEIAVLQTNYLRVSQALKGEQRQRAEMLASRSWRMIAGMRHAVAGFPRLSHWAFRSAEAAKLLATLQFKRLYKTTQLRHRTRDDRAALAGSSLFHVEFYLHKYPDVASFIGGPLQHYILMGAKEGRDPHPLFDSQWYLSRNPSARSAESNPLIHYLKNRHLSPNPYFDGQWYLETYPDVNDSGVNPLEHYYKFGAAEGRDPGPNFATRWYLEQNPDLLLAGVNPLEHFLRYGQAEGRQPSWAAPLERPGKPVTHAEIHCLKVPGTTVETGLFVAHSPDGKLKPHVEHYLKCLKASGISIILLVAADVPFTANSELLSLVSGLFVRRNEGYDFAAWAHILRLRPDLLDSEILYLLNDSLIGPFDQGDFDRMLGRLRSSSADLIGLTANHERTGWHLQSYFLALKKTALASVALQRFFNQVTTLDDKNDVINQYELRFAPTLRAAGLDCIALFLSEGPSNPTIYDWRGLIERGFPFVKVMVLRDRFENVNITDWPDVLRARGFDPELATSTVNEARRLAPAIRSDLPLSDAPTMHFDPPPVLPRVSLIAPWNFDNGLGVASRSYISALRKTGVQLNLHPIKRPFHVHRQLAPPFDICDFSGDTDVVLIQLNPDGWGSMFTESQSEIIRRARVRIGLWVWETPTVPETWLSIMNKVDAIWAPSQYCADAFSAAVHVPVHVVPYVVATRSAPASDTAVRTAREAIGNRSTERIILYAFDGSSYLVRKNPFALVRAFGRSRLHDQGWTLVLKTKHVFDSQAQGKALAELVAATSGVVMLNRSLDKDAMGALMAASSIYASPHCAEGFGLTVAEAMGMGKLVVATDYSGTRDFLDIASGFPVDYQLRALEDDHGAYGSGNTWATVDEAKLSEALLAAADEAVRGDSSKCEAAVRRIREKLSQDAVADRMIESLSQLLPIELIAALPARRIAP